MTARLILIVVFSIYPPDHLTTPVSPCIYTNAVFRSVWSCWRSRFRSFPIHTDLVATPHHFNLFFSCGCIICCMVRQVSCYWLTLCSEYLPTTHQIYFLSIIAYLHLSGSRRGGSSLLGDVLEAKCLPVRHDNCCTYESYFRNFSLDCLSMRNTG